jgi:hypothetical protein
MNFSSRDIATPPSQAPLEGVHKPFFAKVQYAAVKEQKKPFLDRVARNRKSLARHHRISRQRSIESIVTRSYVSLL